MTIDGALGASTIDTDSGVPLGTIGGDALDMELAGAGSTVVVQEELGLPEELGGRRPKTFSSRSTTSITSFASSTPPATCLRTLCWTGPRQTLPSPAGSSERSIRSLSSNSNAPSRCGRRRCQFFVVDCRAQIVLGADVTAARRGPS